MNAYTPVANHETTVAVFLTVDSEVKFVFENLYSLVFLSYNNPMRASYKDANPQLAQ